MWCMSGNKSRKASEWSGWVSANGVEKVKLKWSEMKKKGKKLENKGKMQSIVWNAIEMDAWGRRGKEKKNQWAHEWVSRHVEWDSILIALVNSHHIAETQAICSS